MSGKVWFGLLAGVVLGAAAVAAAPSVAVADNACGSKENPCPLQKWMRQNMAPANASGDMPALAAALEKASTFAPDPSWNGKEIIPDLTQREPMRRDAAGGIPTPFPARHCGSRRISATQGFALSKPARYADPSVRRPGFQRRARSALSYAAPGPALSSRSVAQRERAKRDHRYDNHQQRHSNRCADGGIIARACRGHRRAERLTNYLDEIR